MTHYICTGGCGGVNDRPGICQAAECEKYGEALDPCECTDGEHGGLADTTAQDEGEE